MNKKIIATIFVIILALLLTTHNTSFSSPETTMQVDPPETIQSICNTFSININVTNVEKLHVYRFTLKYNTSILDAKNVEKGGFFGQGEFMNPTRNDSIGEVTVIGGANQTTPPVSDNVILAIIEFECTGVGNCSLMLTNTSLKDDEGSAIPHTPKNGKCTVLPERSTPIDVYEDYKLCDNVIFQGSKGFILHSDNITLNLNGHNITYQPTGQPPGLTGIEVKGITGVTIKNGTINEFQYGVWVENSNGVVMSSLDIVKSTDSGIGIRNSNDVQVTFNNISGATNDGIAIDGSSFDVSILNSTISGSKGDGIAIDGSSFDVSILNSIISGSGDVGIGVYGKSYNVSIIQNTVAKSTNEGIHIKDSSFNTVSNNMINGSGYYGIYLFESNKDTIDTNILRDNRHAGMYVENSNGNIIYHNNFINNTIQDVECKSSINTWDTGYGTAENISFGGNYWTFYDGVDVYSGMRDAMGNQNVHGRDGIGDTVHIIDVNNRDNYPIKEPWNTMLTCCCLSWKMRNSSMEWQENCHAAVYSDSSPKDFLFNRKARSITFNVSNGSFCRVIVSKEGLCGALNVTIDGVPRDCVINSDKTHYFINFTPPSGNHEVKITGELASSIVGDVNGDGTVNILDLALAAKNFGMTIVE